MRRELRDEASPFTKRSYLLSDEIQQALLDPEPLVTKMEAHHTPGQPQKFSLQIRLRGGIKDSIRVTNELRKLFKAEVRIMKVERDRRNRTGDFVSNLITIYVNVKGQNAL